MSRTAQLVKGSESVNLINTGVTGIIASRGGFGSTRVNPNLTFVSSSLANSASLRLKNYPPIVENWRLNLKASSQDNAALQLQTLWRILLDADRFQLTDWQQTPVYLQEQFTNETNPHYSLVIAWSSFETGDMFAQPFENDNDLDSFQITIVREPFFRGAIPGILPDPITLLTPDWEFFDSETIGSGGAINITKAAALSGDWGAAFTLAGASSETFGTVNPAIVGVASYAEFSTKFEMKGDDLVMASGDGFFLHVTEGSGALSSTFTLVYRDISGVRSLQLLVGNDSSTTDDTSIYNLISGTNTVEVNWKASTAPGNDDGEAILTINGDLKETLSGLDNDTYDVDLEKLGGIVGLDAGTTGTLYIDNIQYDNASPFVAAQRTIDFEPTIGYLGNHRHTNKLSHIFVFDESLASFGSNQLNETNFRYFPNPAQDEDIIYFGGEEPFFGIALDIGTGGAITSSFDIKPEYWNGAAWVTTGDKASRAAGEMMFSGFTGHAEIANPGFSDWAKTAINGETKYWIRLRADGGGSIDTIPRQGDQIVFTMDNTYVQLNSGEIVGDQPAIALLRLLDWATITSGEIDWIAYGGKSRGLTDFQSRLNPGGQNPAGWNVVFGTDSSSQADNTAPAGATGRCTFATDQTLISRIQINDASFPSGAGAAGDYEGRYNIFIRARQTLGAAGDVSVQLAITRGVEFLGPTVKTKQVDEGFEIMFLGEFSMLSEGVRNTESDDIAGLDMFFDLNMSAVDATPIIDVYDIIFIPIDEVSMVASWSNRSNQALDPADVLNIDAGILRQNTAQLTVTFSGVVDDVITPTPLSIWQTRGKLPEIEPRRDMNIYFLFGSTNSTSGIIESNQGMTTLVQLFIHEQWNIIRGAD